MRENEGKKDPMFEINSSINSISQMLVANFYWSK